MFNIMKYVCIYFSIFFWNKEGHTKYILWEKVNIILLTESVCFAVAILFFCNKL